MHTPAHDVRPAMTDRLPWALVGAAVLFGLIVLWPERRDVWYLNDSAVHRSMVTWAADRIREHHLPFDGWYPYLSLGASRFHHYQSLPHIVTGALSVVTGPGTFRWSLYLLLATWPISVYAGGRLLGLGRWPAAGAALVAPLLTSTPGLGYEWGTYVWRGWGAWAQLWGMWLLPLAWGASWRAVAKGKQLWVAALLVGLTCAAHLLTGYLALLSLGVFVVVTPTAFARRLVRALVVGASAIAAAAWMIVPVIQDARWAIQDEFSRHSFYYDSFGARKVLGWLVTGALFDAGRLPVVSVLVAIGGIVAVRGWVREESARVLLMLFTLSLILFCGRPTFGSVLDLLPGGRDLFLRRYIGGVHMASLFLAGLGVTWLGAMIPRLVDRVFDVSRRAVVVASVALIAAVLIPAVLERIAYEREAIPWLTAQTAAEATDGADFESLVGAASPDGRLFAGKRSGQPSTVMIGSVPGYAALLDLQADAVGFTRPTWSLMSGSEYRLDPSDPSQLELFGVRNLIQRAEAPRPAGTTRVGVAGDFVLYRLDDGGYVHLVDTIAPITADRVTIGQQTSSFLSSGLFARGFVPTIAFDGADAAPPTLGSDQEPTSFPGEVLRIDATPANGVFRATVRADRTAVVAFSVSFDPRFVAIVDGQEASPFMVAPALIGVRVEPGRHTVGLTYRPYPWYPALFAVGVIGIMLVWAAGRRRPDRSPT